MSQKLCEAAEHLISDFGLRVKDNDKIAPFLKKEKKNIKAIVWAACFLCCVCNLVLVQQQRDAETS